MSEIANRRKSRPKISIHFSIILYVSFLRKLIKYHYLSPSRTYKFCMKHFFFKCLVFETFLFRLFDTFYSPRINVVASRSHISYMTRVYRLIERRHFNCEIRGSTTVDGKSMVIVLAAVRWWEEVACSTLDVTGLCERLVDRVYYLAVLCNLAESWYGIATRSCEDE